MELHGICIKEDENNGVNDLQFLEDMMDLNEHVAELPKDEELALLKRQTEGKNYKLYIANMVQCAFFTAHLQDSVDTLTVYFSDGKNVVVHLFHAKVFAYIESQRLCPTTVPSILSPP